MATLKNHPGMWLRDDAAAALDAWEDAHGVIRLNSAGRTVAEQQNLINRWDRGGAANRPPHLYTPARPPSASTHVKDGGIAIDTSEIARFKATCGGFGFVFPYANDPVHAEFRGGGSRPASNGANQVTRDRQNWLISLGYDLGPSGADGIEGPKTRAAYHAYQEYLRDRGWYTLRIDGKWESGTQAAHEKKYAEVNAPKPGVVASAGVPAGTRWYGIQKMLKRLYGYQGRVDNIAGDGTLGAFDRFLKANGYWDGNRWTSAQRWLKARYGYAGKIDGDYDSGTLAAWAKAENANWRAY